MRTRLWLGCASHPIAPFASQLSSLPKTALAIRRIAEQSGTESLVANMSRQIFRGQYVDTTIDSCDEFIQLSFLRGKPNLETIDRLKQSGVRVNYSCLRDEDTSALRRELGVSIRPRGKFRVSGPCRASHGGSMCHGYLSGSSALEWPSALHLPRASPLHIYSVTTPTPSPNEALESPLVTERWSGSRAPTND